METLTPDAPGRAPLDMIGRVIGAIEAGLAALSRIALFAIMMIVIADVALRYLFHAPLSWPYPVIGNYLMVLVFFFALPNTLSANHHIEIDIFKPLYPVRFRELSLAIGFLASAVVMILIAHESWLRFARAWSGDERLASTVAWPTWITHAVVWIGVGVFVLRILHRAGSHLIGAITGKPLVALHAPGDLPEAAPLPDSGRLPGQEGPR